jgi:cell division protein FtsX
MLRLNERTSLLVKRGIRRGLLTLQREREFGVTLGALFGVLLLCQMLVGVTVGIQGLHRLLRSQLDLRLTIQDTASDQGVQEFMTAIKGLPSVERVTYVTKEQAYEREASRNPDLIHFLEEFKIQNPFPDTLAVTLTSLGEYDAFKAYVQQEQWKETVDPSFLSQSTNQEREVRQMITLAETGRALAFGFLAVLALVMLFVLIELTRRRAMQRREELLVERLVGAPELSMLVPFITEAAALLLAALVLSGVGMAVILWLLPRVLPVLAAGSFAALHAQVTGLLWVWLPVVTVAEIVMLLGLACAGAYLGVKRRREVIIT